MPACAPPRPAATNVRAAIAVIAAMLGCGTAAAEPPAGSAPVELLVGRWSGQGFIRGVELEPGAAIILDIRACGGKLCGRPVRQDGACGETIIEIDGAGAAAPERAQPLRDVGSHRGRIVRAGLPAAEVAVTHVAGAADRPAQVHVREATVPLYSRRLPDVVSVSLRYQGPTACEMKPTS